MEMKANVFQRLVVSNTRKEQKTKKKTEVEG